MNLKQLQYLLVKNENDQLIIYETVCFGLYKERVHYFLGMQNNTFTQWIELESCSRKIREQQYLQEIKGNNVAVILAKKMNKSLDDVNVSVQQSVLDECSFNIHEQKEGLPKLDEDSKGIIKKWGNQFVKKEPNKHTKNKYTIKSKEKALPKISKNNSNKIKVIKSQIDSKNKSGKKVKSKKEI